MSRSPSRHTRLTSLVGALLTAAVAACLVAFSLVAQHAAQQSPGAPSVRPLLPDGDAGEPIEIAPFASEGETGEPTPTPSTEDEIDALIALADETRPAEPVGPSERQVPGAGFPRRGPQRPEPQVGPGSRNEPTSCGDTRCRPGSRPTRTSQPAGGPGDDGCDDDHARQAAGHRGRGKGHCKAHGRGHDSSGPGRPHHPGDRPDPAGGPTQPAATPSAPGGNGNGHGQGSSSKPASAGPPPHARAHGSSTPPGRSKSKSGPPGHAKAKGHGRKH